VSWNLLTIWLKAGPPQQNQLKPCSVAYGLIGRKQFLRSFYHNLELMFAADSFNSCNFMCSVEHIRVTIPHVIVTSRVTIARVIALVAYRLPGSRYSKILTCFRAKPCGHFGFEDLMWLKSVEVHACRTASSGKAWFWSSTDRQYFCIFPAFLGSIQWVLHIFLGKLFLFLQNKNFSKSNKFVFQVTWACELLSNCWFVEKLAWAC